MSGFSRLLDLLYPRRCPLCGSLSPESPCAVCLSDFPEARFPFRSGDGEVASWASVYSYHGRAAQAVQLLKYNRRTSLSSAMSAALKRRYEEVFAPVDAVVPVPIHWSRRCTRGFNQSELLCEAFPAALVRTDVLFRVRATRPQVGLSHEERLTNLQGAFRAKGAPGMSILLVDDVLTSGQTARECARALRAAGAREVAFLAFAGETER
ncbi:MAG TPA: phosphoribosyltransferase family protein [Fimbriimonas sp.]